MADEKLYPDINPMDVEPHYSQHLSAMTTKALHSKAAIAEQLAWRDQTIEQLKNENADLKRDNEINSHLFAVLAYRQVADVIEQTAGEHAPRGMASQARAFAKSMCAGIRRIADKMEAERGKMLGWDEGENTNASADDKVVK